MVLDASNSAASSKPPTLPPDPRRTSRGGVPSSFFSPAMEASRVLGFSTTPKAEQSLQKSHLDGTPHNKYVNNNNHTPAAAKTTTPTTSAPSEEETAADFSRQSSVTMAGFLSKLGQEVPEFKRRFFVLQPATHLYYFLSPTDTEPRGCLELEGARLTKTETLPDGRCRFALAWDVEGQQQQHQVVLEARSERVAQEWRHAMETHRYSYMKHDRDRLSRRQQTYQDRIRELEKQIENFRLVEKDRDGALEDAARWRQQFEDLDEAIRKLTRTVARPDTDACLIDVDEGERDKGDGKDVDGDDDVHKESGDEIVSEKTDQEVAGCDRVQQEGLETIPLEPQHTGQASRESSLLDETLGESGESQPTELDVDKVPGLYFGGLYNACCQLQENVRRAGEEARTAVQDIQEAQDKVRRLEKRGNEAEKHLLRLWEENCTLRKSVKQKKREKRVLIREVRSMQDIIKEAREKEANEAAQRPRRSPPPPTPQEEDATHGNSDLETSDEEKLINELEGHVMSSIRLHEQILAAQSPTPKSANTSFEFSKKRAEKQLKKEESHDSSSQAQTLIATNSSHSQGRPPLPPKHSLMDDESEDSSDEESDEGDSKVFEKGAKISETKVVQADDQSISSLFAEASVEENKGFLKHLSIETSSSSLEGRSDRPPILSQRPTFVSISSSPDSSPERPNPLFQLDALENDEESQHEIYSEPTKPKSMTLAGQATSNLACALTSNSDHSTRRQENSRSDAADELQVYHLTFYSRKIGLQFQKVPPPPVKAKGLLTDALRMDLVGGIPEASDRTVAELRTIANLSSRAKTEIPDEKKEDTGPLKVASPVDAVLICGFQGFDDSGVKVRPKLGARLVAFDGVSVEIGRWTFDSIRKAIQARGRPLTLSFRNDFLTTEQREILTRAVKEANTSWVPSVTTELSSELPSSSAPSVHSVSSHETGAFVNDDVVMNVKNRREEPLNFAETDSVSAMSDRSRPEIPLPTMLSERKRTPYSFRSFSDVGSSTSSVLSAVGPLMAHLMPPRQSEPFTPDYMLRSGRSIEETPEHQDFTSTLL